MLYKLFCYFGVALDCGSFFSNQWCVVLTSYRAALNILISHYHGTIKRWRNSLYKYKPVSRPSYLYYENLYTWIDSLQIKTYPDQRIFDHIISTPKLKILIQHTTPAVRPPDRPLTYNLVIPLVWTQGTHVTAFSCPSCWTWQSRQNAIRVNTKTAEIIWVRNQHSCYWCPGAKEPGHQYPQC